MEAQTNHQSKLEYSGNQIWHGDLITNGENLHKERTPLSEFQVTIPKKSTNKKQAATSIYFKLYTSTILQLYTDIQLNIYFNLQLDLIF